MGRAPVEVSLESRTAPGQEERARPRARARASNFLDTASTEIGTVRASKNRHMGERSSVVLGRSTPGESASERPIDYHRVPVWCD